MQADKSNARLCTCAFAFIVAGVILATHLKILTYVTGQDPFTYTRLALQLLENHFDGEQLRSVSAFIAPGYPMFLAAIIGLLGPYAVAWSNWLVMVLAWVFLFFVTARRLGPVSALVAVIISWVLIIAGYPLNAHFILYPFRGALQLLAMVTAVVLVTEAKPEGRAYHARMLATIGVLLAGALIRETVLLVWPALALAVIIRPGTTVRRRIIGTSWLLSPLVLMTLLLVLAWFAGWWRVNQQADTWLHLIQNQPVDAYAARLAAYAAIIKDEMGWFGLLGLLVAAWFYRRRPDVVMAWMLPAVLMILFYCVFMVHRRYALDAIAPLAILSGLGWGGLVHNVLHAKAWRLRTPAAAAALLLIMGISVVAIRDLDSWGTQVRSDEIKELIKKLRSRGPDKMVLADEAPPIMLEALMLFGRVNPLDNWTRWTNEPVQSSAIYFNMESAELNRPGISRFEMIQDRADLLQAAEDALAESPSSLGNTRYSIYEVTPWSQLVVETQLVLHVEGRMLWLDFRSSDPQAVRLVELTQLGGAVKQKWSLNSGHGLIPLVLDSGWRSNALAKLRVTSSSPLPKNLLAQPVQEAGRYYFVAAAGRAPSLMKWFIPPTSVFNERERWGVLILNDGAIRYPRPRVMSQDRLDLLLVLESRWPDYQPTRIVFQSDGQPLDYTTKSLSRVRFECRIPVQPSLTHDYIPLEINIQHSKGFHNHFRIVYVGMELSEIEH